MVTIKQWQLYTSKKNIISHTALIVVIILFYSLNRSTVCEARATRSSPDEVESYNKYYNYENLTLLLKSLFARYSHIANLSSVGQSVQGRELWVMRITKEPTSDGPGKPKFKYVGNMHGDETVSRQVLVYLVEYLLTRYGEDPRVTDLVNSTDIYVMPSMNPDGFEKSKEGDCHGKNGGRENAKNLDLNRSFPDQFDTINVRKEDIPEVTAVIKWILDNKYRYYFPSAHRLITLCC